MATYKISILDSDDSSIEDPINEDISPEEAYQDLLDYLDSSDNIFCEETSLFYASGKWFRPDDDDDLWKEEHVIHVPSEEEVITKLNKDGIYTFPVDDFNYNIKISRM